MEHGVTWLSFLPGYQQFQNYLAHSHTALLGSAVVVQHVYAAVVVLAIIVLLAWRARVELDRAPDGGIVPDAEVSIRNFLEVIFEVLYGQMQQIIGPQSQRYFPVIGALGLFIFVSNVLGLIPGFVPPTDNWNTTFACGLFVFLYYNFHGLRAHGLGHIGHMANPTGAWWGWFLAPLMFPIELVSHCARPFSLGVRLAANMVGDHAVLLAFLSLMPILVPLPFLALGLIVSLVQAFVFVLLSMIYIALAVGDEHEHGNEQDENGHHEEAHA